ncbi:MAG: GNAT family N-acetyltransferase [Planctomycetota bacterium]|nr:GNAT family N-acetyltransferase [Planctomycetota bacterium]
MIYNVTPEFETTRLVASQWKVDFAEPAFEIYSDTEVTRFIGGMAVRDVDQMRSRIGEIIERNRSFPPGLGSYPMFLKSTGSLVGTALIKPLPDPTGKLTRDVEIGWHLSRRQWGRGYATEWGKKLMQIAFEELELPEVHAVIDPPNEKSKKVAERLGMEHLGQTTAYYHGEPIEHYRMRRMEWGG